MIHSPTRSQFTEPICSDNDLPPNGATSVLMCRVFQRRRLLEAALTYMLLLPTVSEFAQELGVAMENHSVNVRRLVDDFRSRSAETRVDSGGMRRVWESLLRQVEADAVAHLDLASVLQQQLSQADSGGQLPSETPVQKGEHPRTLYCVPPGNHILRLPSLSLRAVDEEEPFSTAAQHGNRVKLCRKWLTILLGRRFHCQFCN